MEVLDKIAQLITEDPFLTANQIAKRLGYAEEKTVYYWIDKGHFGGLTAFKRAVLRGHYPRTLAGESKARYGPLQIPVVEEFGSDAHPIFSGELISLVYRPVAIQFAWRYRGERTAHILPGDILLVVPLAAEHFRWVLAFTSYRQPVVRVVLHIPGGETLINPENQALEVDAIPLYALSDLYRPL